MHDSGKWLRTYKHLLISGLMLTIAICGLLIGVWPAAKKYFALRDETAELSKKNKALTDKVRILESIDEDTYTNLYAELLRAVPADQSLVTIFATVDGLAANSGVTIGNFSFSAVGGIASDSAQAMNIDPESGSVLLPFSLNIVGPYEKIREYLARVPQVRRVLRVKSFDFMLRDAANMTVNLSMDAFYRPYRSSIGAVDAPVEPLTSEDNSVISIISGLPIVVGVGDAISPAGAQEPTTENKENIFEP